MDRFDLLQPSTTDEALGLLAAHAGEAQIIGGGAMLSILLHERLVTPRYVISLDRIAELAQIRTSASALELGATCTLRQIERHDGIERSWPTLVQAIQLVGNVRVRNVATIGGHLAQADPHMDLPPVLAALGAQVHIRSAAASRTIGLGDLLTGYYETALTPDEMIVGVSVPNVPDGLHGAYVKFCALSPNDWPTVGVAAFARLDDGHLRSVRVVAGCVAERPLRLPEAEAILEGQSPSLEAFAEVGRRYAAAADPLSDVRGSADYKRRVTGVIVRRALEAACQPRS